METLNYRKFMEKKVTAMLKPFGLKRFNRYNDDFCFIDDQGWFISIFDLQLPTDFDGKPHQDVLEKYYFVSCGIDFNWDLSSSITLNFPDDFIIFLEFADEEHFIENLIIICMETIKKTLEYRNYLRNIKTAKNFIMKNKFGSKSSIWTNYNRGVISGLAGNIENLNKYFDKILAMNEKNNRHSSEKMLKDVLDLKNIANKDINKFTKKILSIMNKARELKKLDKMQIKME